MARNGAVLNGGFYNIGPLLPSDRTIGSLAVTIDMVLTKYPACHDPSLFAKQEVPIQ